MLNLKQIHNVTEEEKQSKLYQWAKLFKATTWEELKMLAKKDTSISEFTFTLHEMTEEEKIWEQCLARDLYEHDQASTLSYGKKLGREEGLKEGLNQGKTQINELYRLLIEADRLDDLKRSTTDSEYQQQLLQEFGL